MLYANRIMKVCGIAGALCAGTLMLSSVNAQTYNDANQLLSRIEGLEKDLRDLQREYYQNSGNVLATAQSSDDGSVNESTAARMSIRLNELENALRTLRGLVEESNHRSLQVASRFDRMSQDVEYRLGALEQEAGLSAFSSTPSGNPPSQTAAQPNITAAPTVGDVELSTPAPLPSGTLGTVPVASLGDTPEQKFKTAHDLLFRGDYQGGEVAFRAFLDQHPDDPLAGKAQFWLGESYYARRNYRDAAQTYLAGIKQYPRSEKAPDSLLKLGLSLINLGDVKDGCGVLSSIRDEYPKASRIILDTAKRERNKASCP